MLPSCKFRGFMQKRLFFVPLFFIIAISFNIFASDVPRRDMVVCRSLTVTGINRENFLVRNVDFVTCVDCQCELINNLESIHQHLMEIHYTVFGRVFKNAYNARRYYKAIGCNCNYSPHPKEIYSAMCQQSVSVSSAANININGHTREYERDALNVPIDLDLSCDEVLDDK